MTARTRSLPLVLAVLAAALSARAACQELPRLAIGQLVRVTAPAAGLGKQTGVLVALTADRLVMRPGERVAIGVPPFDTMGTRIPLAQVQRLEVRAGETSHPWRGALVGAVAGAAIGAVAGWSGGDDPPHDQLLCDIFLPCPPSRTAGEKAALGAAVGAAVGATVGRLVGSLIRTEAWVRVPIEKIQIAVVGKSGLALSASLAF